MISHCGGAADFAHHHTPFLKIPYKFRFAKVFHFKLSFFGQIVKWRDILITRFPWGLGKILQDQCHAFPAAYPNSFRPGLTVPRLRSGSSPTQGENDQLRRIDERSKVNGAELFLEWTETDTTSLEY